MKFSFLLGTFAIGILANACGGHRPGDPGVVHDDGATDGTPSEGDGNAAGSNGSGDIDDDDAGADSNDDGDDAGSNSNGDGDDAGSNGDGDDAGSDTEGNDDGGSDAPGSGGTSSSGGSGGSSASAGSAGLSGSGASGGHANAGSGGPSANAGSPGLSGSGGSGDDSGSGGSGDDTGNAGSDDGPGTGGSDSVPATGGSAGLPGSGGSDGVSGSGSGVSGSGSGSGGSDGVSGSGGSDGVSGSGGTGGDSGSGGTGGGEVDHSLDAEYLFTTETFGGNGRACGTCHTAETGTINPAQVQALFAADPADALFRSIDSNDGASEDYSELRARATFRATIALPPGVTLTSDPSATTVVFRRSVPTTINSPSLDPVIMWDGRAPSLTGQALDAIFGHAQATVTPTAEQLELIAGFEKGPDFFSSDLLREYSQGGTEPTWPAGSTESEQRGRRWFAEDGAAPRFNICGQCHGGPMTNTTQANSGLPVGQRFQTANVSEFNVLGNPTYEFKFPDPKDSSKTVTVRTADPGRALITGDVRDLNFFRIPTLWGVKNTAPYFHDNSAKDLEELMEHYEDHLATFLRTDRVYPNPHVPTTQDKADIVAYLMLL